ncbi:hypothetical protein Riv7116_2505 [Rivularia sp. PCC 7116]|nr:hypothetical protein Riv7116_2505 [Rivularia sp. PCC 7116]
MYGSGYINNIFQVTIDNDLASVKAIIKSGINLNDKHPQIQLTTLIQAINLQRVRVKIFCEKIFLFTLPVHPQLNIYVNTKPHS